MSDDKIILTRELAAPPAVVFAAFSEAEKYAQWYGPKGVTITHCTQDFRVGGKQLICMQTQRGDQWTAGEFTAITPDTSLVKTEHMADADGNQVSPASMGMEGWPDELILEIDLAANVTGTTLTLKFGPLEPSPKRDMCAGGWNSALDKLAEFLEA